MRLPFVLIAVVLLLGGLYLALRPAPTQPPLQPPVAGSGEPAKQQQLDRMLAEEQAQDRAEVMAEFERLKQQGN